jgi:hypothetical protein
MTPQYARGKTADFSGSSRRKVVLTIVEIDVRERAILV